MFRRKCCKVPDFIRFRFLTERRRWRAKKSSSIRNRLKSEENRVDVLEHSSIFPWPILFCWQENHPDEIWFVVFASQAYFRDLLRPVLYKFENCPLFRYSRSFTITVASQKRRHCFRSPPSSEQRNQHELLFRLWWIIVTRKITLFVRKTRQSLLGKYRPNAFLIRRVPASWCIFSRTKIADALFYIPIFLHREINFSRI